MRVPPTAPAACTTLRPDVQFTTPARERTEAHVMTETPGLSPPSAKKTVLTAIASTMLRRTHSISGQ